LSYDLAPQNGYCSQFGAYLLSGVLGWRDINSSLQCLSRRIRRDARRRERDRHCLSVSYKSSPDLRQTFVNSYSNTQNEAGRNAEQISQEDSRRHFRSQVLRKLSAKPHHAAMLDYARAAES